MRRQFNVQPGWTVVGSDRKSIGTVKSCTDIYCHIDTGFLGLGPDYYVPYDAIYNVGDRQVFLNVRSDQLGQMGWERVPTTATSTSRQRVVREEARPAAPTAGPMAAGPMAAAPMAPGMAPRTTRREETSTSEGRPIPLEEEQIRVAKREQEVGEVYVTKEIVEETRTFEVPVTREEIIVRERPVEGPARGPIGEGEITRIPVSEERIIIQKEPHVYSEILIEKRRVVEQRPVTETVRREVPRIHKKGDFRTEEEGLPERTFAEREDETMTGRRGEASYGESGYAERGPGYTERGPVTQGPVEGQPPSNLEERRRAEERRLP